MQVTTELESEDECSVTSTGRVPQSQPLASAAEAPQHGASSVGSGGKHHAGGAGMGSSSSSSKMRPFAALFEPSSVYAQLKVDTTPEHSSSTGGNVADITAARRLGQSAATPRSRRSA